MEMFIRINNYITYTETVYSTSESGNLNVKTIMTTILGKHG